MEKSHLRMIFAIIGLGVLPVLAFIALQAAFAEQSKRSEIEREAIEQARQISTVIDARLERTRGAAAALVTNGGVARREWPAAYERAREIAEQNPDWHSVIIWDRRTREVLVRTDLPFQDGRNFPEVPFGAPASDDPSDLFFGGLASDEVCACVLAHTTTEDAAIVLTVRLFIAPFQATIADEGRKTLLTSLVDRDGLIIARTRDQARLLGRAASPAERSALAASTSGFYRGQTLEGLVNYSGFWTSPMTGWSVHVATEPGEVDAPQFRSVTATVVAALASLSIAAALIVLVLRVYRYARERDERAVERARSEVNAQMTIGRDLHDGVLQFLTGLVLKLDSLRQSLSEKALIPPETQRTFLDLQAELRREQRELRRFVENLNARGEESATQYALAATTDVLSQRWGVEVSIEPFDADSLIPEHLRRDMDYILREATANAVRHGNASVVRVKVTRDGNVLKVDLVDNGLGFGGGAHSDGAQVPIKPGTILARVEQHGGELHVASSTTGACLTLLFPVQP